MILSLIVGPGPAFAPTAQAAPLAPQPATIELDAAPPAEFVSGGCGWTGIATIGKTGAEICVGVAAFEISGGDPAPTILAGQVGFSRTMRQPGR
jgi:hypothetical protein